METKYVGVSNIYLFRLRWMINEPQLVPFALPRGHIKFIMVVGAHFLVLLIPILMSLTDRLRNLKGYRDNTET